MSEPALPLNAWLRYDVIRAHVRSLRPSTILEFGVGGGAVGARLAAAAERYVGYEPDVESRALATARLRGRGVIVDDLDDVGGPFSLVCAFEVLEHLDDDIGVLRDWAEHVEPGGHLMLSVPAFSDRMGAWDHRVGHLRRYDPEVLRERLAAAGLDVVEVRAVGFPLGHALEAARNLIARRDRPDPDASMAERTAGSGRTYQPSRAGWVTQAATWPFRLVQRRFPERGTGLVALARKPG